MTQDPKDAKSPLVELVIAWLWAGIPLAWGVSQTVLKAKALFK
jgi:hypothetical protein